MIFLLYFVLPIILIIVIIIASFFIYKNVKNGQLKKLLGLKLLLIRLPQKRSEDFSGQGNSASGWKEEINLSAQLFGILAGLKSHSVLEAAVHHIGEEIHFYISVPRESAESVSRQIEGLFKDAQVEAIDDYNIFNSAGISTGAYLSQKSHIALPIRTYTEANIDTFSPILNGLSKINEIGEGGAIQILIKPAPSSTKKNISQMISNLKKGTKTEEVLKGAKIDFKTIQNNLNPKEKKPEDKTIDDEAIKTLESKISKPLLSINLRVIASGQNQLQCDNILNSITSAFSQFSAPSRQELKVNIPKNPQKLIYQFSFREFDDSQSIILNTEEAASLFHLPAFSTEVPKIKWLKSKEAAPPTNLPTKGTLVGESVFRGDRKQVYITSEDRRRHVYVIGQTGTGKSNLMKNMIIDDVRQGKGVSIIDPHGDFVEDILGLIPRNRVDDVIVFDPSDLWQPLGMNILEYDFSKPEEKTFIVNELFNILDKLYDMKTVGGPMFEQYTKNAILLLMEDMVNEPATLMEIPRVFTDEEFRNKKLGRIANPVVIDFWQKEAAKATGEHSLANMAPYITSKFNNFIANDYLRPIIGQPKSAFNFRKLMDEGKILLVNLSKGRIGDINANLLGMIIVGKILMAALSRVDAPMDKRPDFNLYIDEFQNFSTESIATILSEARKYGLNLTVAHQFIAQLTDKIRDAVFGNVGSMVCFRVGAPDAEFLVKQFDPVFGQNDLINIDNFNAYLKILINGQTSKPFNVKTLPPEKGNKELANEIKEISRVKYGRSRQEIEEEIMKRLRG